MNRFIHNVLGHYLQEEAEEGNDLGGHDEVEQEVEDEEHKDENEDDQDDQDEDEELIVSIGGKPIEQEDKEDRAAPQWVKDLRRDNREAKKRIRELESQIKQVEPKQKAPEVGKKPSLSDPAIDYDEEKFDSALAAWYERKRKADQAEEEARQQELSHQQAWQERLNAYGEQKAKLRVRDYDEAEFAVESSFEVTQQGIIIQGTDNPALVVYAIGKNPEKAKELSAIKDPVKFAVAIGKLEAQLKTQTRKKSAPAPEKTISGTAPSSGTVDSQLERLRKEAEKTGDMSKVHAYKRQLKAKQRS